MAGAAAAGPAVPAARATAAVVSAMAVVSFCMVNPQWGEGSRAVSRPPPTSQLTPGRGLRREEGPAPPSGGTAPPPPDSSSGVSPRGVAYCVQSEGHRDRSADHGSGAACLLRTHAPMRPGSRARRPRSPVRAGRGNRGRSPGTASRGRWGIKLAVRCEYHGRIPVVVAIGDEDGLLDGGEPLEHAGVRGAPLQDGVVLGVAPTPTLSKAMTSREAASASTRAGSQLSRFPRKCWSRTSGRRPCGPRRRYA